MSEPAPSPAPTPDPTPAPAPSPEPQAATRPEWLPEAHWDPAAGIKPEFGAHYTEIAAAHQKFTEQQAALAARKPEDIKIEVKLPEGVKVPEGAEIKIDEKDPRVEPLRQMALKHGWTQEQVDDLVAFDAQQQIAAFTAEQTRLSDEKKKLGNNADDRIKAAAAWATGLSGLTPDERAEINVLTATAAGVSFLEKIIAKVNGAVPNAGNEPPAKPQQAKTLAERMYPNHPTTRAS